MNQRDSEISSNEPEMSLLQYFSCVSKPDGVSLPSPLGSLSLSIPTAAVASANAEVRHVMEAAGTNQRKGPYNTYTAEQRAIIGKHALENGVMAAKRNFSKKLQMDINESTVRRFKEAYLKERSRKRQVEDDDVSVNELPVKKRGRKVVLGTWFSSTF